MYTNWCGWVTQALLGISQKPNKGSHKKNNLKPSAVPSCSNCEIRAPISCSRNSLLETMEWGKAKRGTHQKNLQLALIAHCNSKPGMKAPHLLHQNSLMETMEQVWSQIWQLGMPADSQILVLHGEGQHCRSVSMTKKISTTAVFPHWSLPV
jgi:hypothetical protein